MDSRKIRVAITHGDTNGIGYELIFKAFEDPMMLDLCTPIIYGSPKVAAYHCDALGIDGNAFSIINTAADAQDGRINLLPVFDEEIKIDLGMPSQEASRAAIKSIDRAITDYKDGLFDVLITGPVDKNNMHVDGFDFPCNEKFIESCLGDGKKGIDLLINGMLRLAFVTDDIALKDVPAAITKENIISKVAAFYTTLRRDFSIESPRIAVLALNPNDTDAHPGKEEQEAIDPAIQQLSEAGVCVFGPYQAETFFGNGYFTDFDGVLAMYHDQGVAPFKALDPDCNIHYLGGLPLISTSTDMGPRYDIAGQNKADAQAFRYAIYQAIDSFRTRNNFDEPYANPLPKLYHERKDESEKVRFSIPKKHENAIKEHRKPAAEKNNKAEKNAQENKPAQNTKPVEAAPTDNTPNAEQ
jgi:4-hydroxythreonine-4-phosphate dehydrogenase